MTDTKLVFVDVETTGLDARVHDAWEVCIWPEGRDQPITRVVPHSLNYADRQALAVGGYFTRGRRPDCSRADMVDSLLRHLTGVTLVAANPAFDQAFLTKLIGAPVWHYRLIDVCTGAMWLLGWDRPRSLLDTAEALRDRGYDIHEPDHTAEGDVRAVRDVYESLRHMEAVVIP